MFVDIIVPSTQAQTPIQDFVRVAQQLSIHGVCVIGTNQSAVPVANTTHPPESQPREQPPNSQRFPVFYGSLSTARKKQSSLIVHRSQGDDRSIIEHGSIDLIYDLETSPRQDFLHHRNSGLNQVLCRLLQQKKIAYAIAFSTLLRATSPKRYILLGRIMQNILLCRKYKVPMVLASFAQTPFELRSAGELQSLGISLGMQPTEAKVGLGFLAERIKQQT